MKYASIIASWVLALVVLLIVATMEATDRSRERVACYRIKQSIEACPRPAWWEDILSRVASRQQGD